MKIRPKKSLGQNFLKDNNILDLIIKLGDIKSKNTVIEIGPGTGNLTNEIIKKNPLKLIVIEKDNELAKNLKIKFKENIKLINQDILKIKDEDLVNENMIIFGNLPYNISTQILINWIRISNLKNYCKRFILLFQKEVADRIIAEENSNKYGRLSILSSWKFNIKKIIDINPNSFYPIPKVKSSLLVFEPKQKHHNLINPKNLEHVTNIFFNQRRKMIKKPLKILFENFEQVATSLSLDLKLRPQNIKNSTYYKICSIYEKSLK